VSFCNAGHGTTERAALLVAIRNEVVRSMACSLVLKKKLLTISMLWNERIIVECLMPTVLPTFTTLAREQPYQLYITKAI
jgi:hypothetical protein